MKNSEEVNTNIVEEEKNEKELTDDELYAKIQTEKLIKRRKTKKFATFTGLCVALVLAIAVIVMATVPISFKPNCIESGFDSVSFISGNTSPQLYNKNEKGYSMFMNYYNKAFSQTFLTALFNGSLNSYEINDNRNNNKLDETEEDRINQFKTIAGTDNFVKVHYKGTKEEGGRVIGKKLTKQNGSIYHPRYYSTNVTLTFNDAYIAIDDEEGFKDTKIFVIATYPVFSSNEITDYVERYIEITVKADTNIIYKAWNDLIKAGV